MIELATHFDFVKEYSLLRQAAEKLTARMLPGNRCGWYWRWDGSRYVGYLWYNPSLIDLTDYSI